MTREEIQKELSDIPTYLNADDHTKEIMISIFAIGFHLGMIDGIEEGAAIWRPSDENYKELKNKRP